MTITPEIALEALMTHPRYAELVEELRAITPVGLLDQSDAATSEAFGVMMASARVLGTENVRGAMPAQVTPWLRLSALSAVVDYITGRADTCRHSPHPSRPQPVSAAAWRPGLIVCQGCSHLLALPPGSAQDRTCDACGRVCAGVEEGDGIHPALIQVGSVIFLYGTCADCHVPTADTRPVVPRQRTAPRGNRGTGRGRR